MAGCGCLWHYKTTRKPPVDHLVTPRWPLGDHLVTTWWPLGDHLVNTWWLLGDYLVITCWLIAYCILSTMNNNPRCYMHQSVMPFLCCDPEIPFQIKVWSGLYYCLRTWSLKMIIWCFFNQVLPQVIPQYFPWVHFKRLLGLHNLHQTSSISINQPISIITSQHQ